MNRSSIQGWDTAKAVALRIGDAGTWTAPQTIDIWGAQMVMGGSAGTPLLTADTTTNVVDGSTKYLAANGLKMSFAYDAFCNIEQSGNWSFQQAYTTANQLSGWTYDGAGNLLVDGWARGRRPCAALHWPRGAACSCFC